MSSRSIDERKQGCGRWRLMICLHGSLRVFGIKCLQRAPSSLSDR